jgi:hypothetical protein
MGTRFVDASSWGGVWSRFREELLSDPLVVLALCAAVFAFATTPIAFAVLGRLDWFKARRGRIMQRPEFSSIVVGMLLAMGIPAIFSALLVKSRWFDQNRYEFDPNRTWTVLEQGRGFKNVREADAAVKQEMERLSLERKNLVDNVKKLDEAMLALRNVAGTSPGVAQRLPSVLQSLAGVRKSVGLDGPQQLIDETAHPADLRATAPATAGAQALVATAPAPPPDPATHAVMATPGANGPTPAEIEAELVAVPEPQRKLASMLPLAGLPTDWTLGKSGDRHIETFNADNLYEKIDGRAESFIQYSVKGMAYAFYHPTGDPSNELQLYVFEMADALKALGKYGSEKPEEAKPVAIGDEGYTSAGSTLFYSGRYYTQIVSTQDDAKFAAFALELARQVAARQKPAGASGAGATSSQPARTTTVDAATPNEATTPKDGGEAAAEQDLAAAGDLSPESFFKLLPTADRQGKPNYVARDVFGYSFLTDVFMADYKEGDITWQGFVRPYRDITEAKSMLEQYVAGVKKDGAEVKTVKADGADEMVVSSNIGLVDVVFRKGNTLAGANGATVAARAETFARGLAKSLPANVKALGSGK